MPSEDWEKLDQLRGWSSRGVWISACVWRQANAAKTAFKRSQALFMAASNVESLNQIIHGVFHYASDFAGRPPMHCVVRTPLIVTSGFRGLPDHHDVL
jgi:hypothetical protein